jgi:hypothetical protein
LSITASSRSRSNGAVSIWSHIRQWLTPECGSH